MNKLFSGKKILVLGAHPDDGELGCGGAISKLIEEGSEVFYYVFSKCEKSVPEAFPKDILEKEFYSASAELGVKSEKMRILDFSVRDFPANRQEILEELVKIKKELDPDIIFIPSSFDIHQDHSTVHQEAVRAFNHKTILGYELPWTNRSFLYSAFFNLDEGHLNKKIAASKCYKSQKDRKYMDEDFLRGWARMRGMQSGSKYAEAFEIIQLTIN